MKNWKAYLAIITAMLIWATSGIASQKAMLTFSPLTMVIFRFTLAVALVAIVGYSFHLITPIRWCDAWVFVLCGFFQPFIYFVLESNAYHLISSPTIAESLLSTNPLIAPLFAALILRERVTWQNIVGILVSTLGMFLLVLNFGGENVQLGNRLGVLLALLAVCAAVCYSILLRRVPTQYNAVSIVFYAQLSSLFFLIPTWLISDYPSIDWQAVWSNPKFNLSLGSTIYLSLFSSIVAFVLFCFTVRQIGVTRANVFNNVRPVFTAIIMLLFFSEQLPFVRWLGIAIVILGLFLCQMGSGKNK